MSWRALHFMGLVTVVFYLSSVTSAKADDQQLIERRDTCGYQRQRREVQRRADQYGPAAEPCAKRPDERSAV